MSDVPITLRLAERAVESRRSVLPAAATDAAASALLDWCAVAIGGSQETPTQKLRTALVGSDGCCQLVGVPAMAEPATAALVNGTAAHALELDDIYAPGLYHPGAPTIAAALAVAEKQGVSGDHLLRGIVVGFEVGNRVAETLGPAHYTHWHTTGTAGSIAAAAAGAEVLALDSERFAHSLALASTMASGLQQTFRSDSMGKPLHSGHAAQVGVVAALSAAVGYDGSLDVLDGPIGLGAVMSDSPSWDAAGEPFGPDYLVQRTTAKPYSCCGHAFAAIDASLQLADAGLRFADIVGVEVQSYATALAVAGNPAPTTTFEAKFSIPFVVTCALREGRLRTDAFTDGTLADPTVRESLKAVTLHESAEFTKAFPERRGARVVVRDTHGRRHEATVPDRRGDPSNPMTPAEMEQKFTSLVEPVLGSARAGQLQQQVRSLATLPDVRALGVGTA